MSLMGNSRRRYLHLSEAAQKALIDGARSQEPVKGLTHGFYKYPARFSPAFARSAILTFTRPGDLVLDPHVGGGTVLVEALANGRDAIGVDISSLAEFVSRTKSTVLSANELDRLQDWVETCLLQSMHIHKPSKHFDEYEELGYYRHLNHRSRWPLRKAIEQGISSATRLGKPRLEAFGRCVILRAAQWALDGRRERASLNDFKAFVKATADEMLTGARQLRASVVANGRRPRIRVLNRTAAGLEDDSRLSRRPPPRLIVTSPPYPGIHVLYHRWQMDGGKEAPLPFMIANKLDGAGASYYTMGDRKSPQLNTYFDTVRASIRSASALADEQTVVVQMLAFSEPRQQLPRYLALMEEEGLSESLLPLLDSQRDGRLWRSVPRRRWYSDQRGKTPASQEVVLFHQKRG
jgi:hypothetical protein